MSGGEVLGGPGEGGDKPEVSTEVAEEANKRRKLPVHITLQGGAPVHRSPEAWTSCFGSTFMALQSVQCSPLVRNAFKTFAWRLSNVFFVKHASSRWIVTHTHRPFIFAACLLNAVARTGGQSEHEGAGAESRTLAREAELPSNLLSRHVQKKNQMEILQDYPICNRSQMSSLGKALELPPPPLRDLLFSSLLQVIFEANFQSGVCTLADSYLGVVCTILPRLRLVKLASLRRYSRTGREGGGGA